MLDLFNNFPTGCCDENGQELHYGDTVRLLNQTGHITFEAGAFGIAIDTGIDWAALDEAIKTYAPPGNRLLACQNDNFISLWEIAWNFNAEDDVLPGVIKQESENE